MPTTRQSLLAGVLRRVGVFSVDSFRERLRVQKTIYLLQAFGVHLGYGFNWYVYGPYSPGLTRDAYEVVPKLARFPEVAFHDQESEERFGEFLEFLGQRVGDPEWLELVASLHMLSRMYPGMATSEIFTKVAQKQPYIPDQKRIVAWNHLQRYGLV